MEKYQKTMKTGDTPLEKESDAYFFYSADCYDKNGVKITYAHGLMGMNTKETKEMMQDPFEFILKSAKLLNEKVVSIHVLALNRI